MIELLNEDCLQVMKRYPDKYFHLAVVDPPYGIGDDKLTSGGTWAAKYKTGDAMWDVMPSEEYWYELFRVSRNQIVWGGNYFIKYLHPSRCWICWDKVSHLPTMADCEYAWTSFDENSKIFKALRSGNKTGEDRIHICQKPVKLYRWIFDKYLQGGVRVLDTHLGCGSSAIAAHQFGIKEFVGCEIDKDYFDSAVKRFNLVTSQTQLF